MRDRRKRNIMIGSLCALLVFMGIGYAIISQMLTIRGVSTVAGDWNIYIDSITPNAVGTGVSINESVGIDKISASFEANLYAPGDKVEYKVVVKNDGNIDAKLGAVNQHVSNDTDNIVKYSNTLENGYILRHGESYVFYVTTELPEELEELPENTVRAVLDLKLNFTQYTGGGSGEEEETKEEFLTGTYQSSEDLFNWILYSNGDLEVTGTGNLDTDGEGEMPLSVKVAETLYTTVFKGEDLTFYNNLNMSNRAYSVLLLTDSFSTLDIDDRIHTKEDLYSIYENDPEKGFFVQGFKDLEERLEKYENVPKIKNVTLSEGIESIGEAVLAFFGSYELNLPSTLERFTYDDSNLYVDLSDLTNLTNFHGHGVRDTTIKLPKHNINIENYFLEASDNINLYFPSQIVSFSSNAFGDIRNSNIYFESTYDNLSSSAKTALNYLSNITVHYGCTGPDASTCSN